MELMHYFAKIDSSPYVSNPYFVNPSVLPVRIKQEKIIDIVTNSQDKA